MHARCAHSFGSEHCRKRQGMINRNAECDAGSVRFDLLFMRKERINNKLVALRYIHQAIQSKHIKIFSDHCNVFGSDIGLNTHAAY